MQIISVDKKSQISCDFGVLTCSEDLNKISWKKNEENLMNQDKSKQKSRIKNRILSSQALNGDKSTAENDIINFQSRVKEAYLEDRKEAFFQTEKLLPPKQSSAPHFRRHRSGNNNMKNKWKNNQILNNNLVNLDPNDKAFIRRAHTNLAIALRGGGGSKVGSARVNSQSTRRKSIDCPYQIWRLSEKSSVGYIPISGVTYNNQHQYRKYQKIVNDCKQPEMKSASEKVAFPPLTSLPSYRPSDRSEGVKIKHLNKQRPTFGEMEQNKRKQSNKKLHSLSNDTRFTSIKRQTTSRRYSDATEMTKTHNNFHDNQIEANRSIKYRNKPHSSETSLRNSPVSASSTERCKSVSKPRKNASRRRSSMPVVCVNGLGMKESVRSNGVYHRADETRNYQSITEVRKPEKEVLFADKIVSRRQNKVSKSLNADKPSSSSDIKYFKTNQTRSKNGENLESKFETILEISPNEAIHHFVSGIPSKGPHQEVVKLNKDESKLTHENLTVGTEDEEEEELFRYQRILDWLEEVETGAEAEQCVHDVIEESNSPEYVRANAIIVVYNENESNS